MSKTRVGKALPPDHDGAYEHQLHVYYGFGKGKTTCCLGLILRALGAGHRAALVQFDKGYDGKNEHYAERRILRKLDGVDLQPTGCDRMMPDGTFRFGVQPQDLAEAQRGLESARAFIREKRHDLVVLDEILAAVAYDLLDSSQVMDLIDLWQQTRACELVLSGHKVWDDLVSQADLVTEMRKVKHYYAKGVPARIGVEF